MMMSPCEHCGEMGAVAHHNEYGCFCSAECCVDFVDHQRLTPVREAEEQVGGLLLAVGLLALGKKFLARPVASTAPALPPVREMPVAQHRFSVHIKSSGRFVGNMDTETGPENRRRLLQGCGEVRYEATGNAVCVSVQPTTRNDWVTVEVLKDGKLVGSKTIQPYQGRVSIASF